MTLPLFAKLTRKGPEQFENVIKIDLTAVKVRQRCGAGDPGGHMCGHISLNRAISPQKGHWPW
jgi:hypothetical protein